MPDRDFYSILGVSRDEKPDAIKKAYRALARELHPDRNPDDASAEDRFKDVSAAYEVLSDPEKRKLYDEFGELGLRDGFDPDAYRAATRGPVGFGGDFGGGGGFGSSGAFDFGDIFGGSVRGGGSAGPGSFRVNLEDLFGGAAGGTYTRTARPGADMQSEVTIEFRDAVLGCTKELMLRSSDGTERSLKVRIPAGVQNEGKIRLRGQGGHGQDGGPAGDLLLRVMVREHPFFSIEGKQLRVRVPVSPLEAYAGAKVSVPTPDGKVTLAVPPGSQTGNKLRIRGKGIEAKGKERGDLIAELEVVLPEGQSPEVEKALETVQDAFDVDPRARLVL